MVILNKVLQGKKILIGISGSIAAYKIVYLVRLLIKAGAEVKVIMTASAKDFVSPLTLSTLSKNPVLSDLFDEQSWANHVMLGRWADVMIIAPLSCNTLAKMASGQCDNLLLAVYLSATCPVVAAPAMDEDMWLHPSTKYNLDKINSYGIGIIPVEKGELASGLHGEGRMAEPEQIIDFITHRFFLPQATVLKGKKAMVTAGPTHEPIDPVRYIGNHSSGKMGIALAAELEKQGTDVTLILGPSAISVPAEIKNVIHVTTSEEMYEASVKEFKKCDIAVMAAAVADYTPAVTSSEKIKKKEEKFTLELTRTKDILKELGTRKNDWQILIGFALETNNEYAHAQEKLLKKNADMIVLNSLRDEGAGFRKDTNKITIFTRKGDRVSFDTKTKEEVAKDIIDTLIRCYYA